jgi:hypothetical protein
MARVAVAGFNRLVPIGSNVFAVVATETAVPILVSNKIRISPPIDFYLRKKVLPVNRLRHADDRVRLRGIGIRCAQIVCDPLLRFGFRRVRFDQCGDYFGFYPGRVGVEPPGR